MFRFEGVPQEGVGISGGSTTIMHSLILSLSIYLSIYIYIYIHTWLSIYTSPSNNSIP